jgi:uncharacterized membrane protein (DUF106 family)
VGIIYALITRFIQNKLVDRKEMKAIQEESKKLSAEMKEAQKSGDKARIDAAMKRQMEFFPKMNKIMFGQFKPMIVIMILFFATTSVLGMFDPSVQDDIVVNMVDDGSGCDDLANDGTYSYCFKLENQNYGKWTATVSAYESGVQISHDQAYFHYNPSENEDRYTEMGTGEPLNITTDKQDYYPGDTVKISATPSKMSSGSSFLFIPTGGPRELNVDSVTLSLSNGTYFVVELPITLPLFNVKRIYQPHWWFIFVAFIVGIVASVAIGQLEKRGMMK